MSATDEVITALLTSFGLPNNDALASTIVRTAATYFPQVIIGSITWLLWRQTASKAVPTS